MTANDRGAQLVMHCARIVNRKEYTICTTLCGRMNRRSRDGMNIADTDAEVTCKHCLKRMKSATGAQP